jgi:sulfonate dioxygenase
MSPKFSVIEVSTFSSSCEIKLWDNRVTAHSATFDFYPHRRHALRATPHGEKPLSVADYEQKTGKRALDREEALGVKYNAAPDAGINKPRGYSD